MRKKIWVPCLILVLLMVISLCISLKKPTPMLVVQETPSLVVEETTTNLAVQTIENVQQTNVIVRDTGATFSVVNYSKSSLAPVAPENPYLNK